MNSYRLQIPASPLRSSKWNSQQELRALPWSRLYFYASVVQLKNAIGHGESDTASSWFCRVKGNEYVARIHESRTVVLNGENQVFVGQLPSQDDLRLRLAGV